MMIYTLLLFFCLICQTAQGFSLGWWGVRIDFSFLFLTFFAIKKGSHVGTGLGFLSGFFLDLFTIYPFGLNTLTRTFIGFFLGKLKRFFFYEYPYAQILIVGIGSLLESILTVLFLLYFFNYPLQEFYFLGNLFFQSVTTSLLTPLFFLLCEKISLWTKFFRSPLKSG